MGIWSVPSFSHHQHPCACVLVRYRYQRVSGRSTRQRTCRNIEEIAFIFPSSFKILGSKQGLWSPRAGIRIWTSLGMITLPTTPSSLSRAHLHLPSLFVSVPPKSQREQLACGWAGAGAERVGWGGGILPVIGQGAEAGRMGSRALQASRHCLPGWRRGLRGKANGVN